MSAFDFDLFVIGGGLAGCARRAWRPATAPRSRSPSRTASAEPASSAAACPTRCSSTPAASPTSSRTPPAGAGASASRTFDWASLTANKDREIARLEGIYKTLLAASGSPSSDRAVLADAHAIRLGAEAHDHGRQGPDRHRQPALPRRGHPRHRARPRSDEAFDLKELPRRIVINGGGYIAAEFAGIFAGPRRGGDDPLPRRQDPARVRRGPARRSDRGLPAAWDPVRHGGSCPASSARRRASRAVSTTAACSRPIRSCMPRAARRIPPTSGSRRSA